MATSMLSYLRLVNDPVDPVDAVTKRYVDALTTENYYRWFGNDIADNTTLTTSLAGTGDTVFTTISGSPTTINNGDIIFTAGSGSTAAWSLTARANILVRFDFVAPTTDYTTTVHLCQIRDTTNKLGYIGLGPTGSNARKIRIYDNSDTLIVSGANQCVAGVRYTVQGSFQAQGSTNYLRANVYNPDGTLFESVVATTLPSTGTNLVNNVRFGAIFGTAGSVSVQGNFAYSTNIPYISSEIKFMPGTLYLPLTGGTLTGLLSTMASTTTAAGLRLPHGTAPTSPTNGDLWTTTAGLYTRINGATVGPLGAGGGESNSSYIENLSAGTTVAVTHNLNTTDVSVTVYKISDGLEVEVPFVRTSANVVTLSSSVDLTGHRIVVLASGGGVSQQYVDAAVPLVLGPSDSVPGGTPTGTIIVRTVT